MKRIMIPVQLGKLRDGAADNFANHPPVIFVHVASDMQWSEATAALPNHNGKVYPALLDTGSEGTSIDQTVALEINAPLTRKGIVSGLSGTHEARGTDIQVILPSANVVYSAHAFLSDFRGAGQTWDLLLGRDFLSHCRLTAHGVKGFYELQWFG